MNQAKTQTRINKLPSQVTLNSQSLSYKDDCKTEELLQAGAKTPLGQLLGKIAQLPEVRFEKVLNLRRQICRGNYQLDEKLEAATDKIIEELLIGP
ncbi:MAG: flagellar biosynthesis anti-sigma factor FlgM [Sedimentisphaerales bacterium]